MIEQRVTLRYDAQQIPAIVQAVQGDTGRDVIFELADYEIPAGATANYYIDKPDGNAIYNSAEVISSTEILAHLTEQALAAPGRNNGQVRILADGEVITSFDFVLEVEAFRGILRLQSETEVNVFDDALQAAAEEAIQEILDQTPVVTGMQNSIAPTYSASNKYAVGDYVMYNAQLYKCNTAITTAEAWTAAHWTQVPIANDVNDLKSALNSCGWVNTFDPYIAAYISRDGTIADFEGWQCTDLIDAIVGDRFIYKAYTTSRSYPALCLYDANGTFQEILREGNAGYDEVEYICTSNCKLRFCSWEANGYPLIVYRAENHIDNFYCYNKPLNSLIIDGMVADKCVDVPLMFESKTGYYDSNKDFNAYSNIWGAIVQVNPITKYRLNYKAYYGMSEVVFFDSSDNVLSANTSHSDDGQYQVEFYPPAGAETMLVQAYGTSELVVSSRTKLDYTDGKILNGEKIDPYSIPYKTSNIGATLDEAIEGNVSPLFGKKIAYDGDSICESRLSGNAENGGAYAKLIADKTGSSYVNKAVSGGILASAVPSGTMPHSVVSSFDSWPDDADLYCFDGGLNDFWRDVPLGDYSPTDYTGNVDTTTVCGALEFIIRACTYYHIGKPVVFVFVHKAVGTKETNNAGYTFDQMREKMIGVCEKYAIPFYDAYTKSGLNGYNGIQSNTFLTANASGVGDGIHPNEAGYRRYYVPQLIALFESIIPVLDE